MSDLESAERRLLRVLDEYGRALRDAVARVCRGPLGLHREEIEQEARIRLWRAFRRETVIGDLRLYLHRVVATAAIDAMRQVRSRREIPLDPPAANRGERGDRGDRSDRGAARAPAVGWPAEGASPERIAASREIVDAARRVLAGLPANRRRAVGLHLQGFTSDEIAELPGWTEAKARNLVHRGLGELREKLRADLSRGGEHAGRDTAMRMIDDERRG